MNSGDFISGKLCYLRALSYARALEMRRDFPDAVELTPEVIVHREYFESQQWWKQEEIRAIAVLWGWWRIGQCSSVRLLRV